jgi:hypothetical protein
VGDNWEDTSFITRPSGRRPNRKVDPIRGPRDAYLRPMIDVTGIRQRLAFKPQASIRMCSAFKTRRCWNGRSLSTQCPTQMGEEELADEFEVNMMESRQAVNFAGELHCHRAEDGSSHHPHRRVAVQLTLVPRASQHLCSLYRW